MYIGYNVLDPTTGNIPDIGWITCKGITIFNINSLTSLLFVLHKIYIWIELFYVYGDALKCRDVIYITDSRLQLVYASVDIRINFIEPFCFGSDGNLVFLYFTEQWTLTKLLEHTNIRVAYSVNNTTKQKQLKISKGYVQS
jgi:hypothetical protein